ncbi:MAG: VOC family protein [Pseudomonadota bacterium]
MNPVAPPLMLDHVAYRCKDAKETADFYTGLLGMKLVAAVTDAIVQSTKERCPHIHVFFAMQDGSCVAFFETPEEKPMGRDPNTPAWVQHLALQVKDRETLMAAKARLEAAGVSVIGPKDGHMCVSIYFFDPSGHRLELTNRKVVPDERSERDAHRILARWAETRQPVTDVELERPL